MLCFSSSGKYGRVRLEEKMDIYFTFIHGDRPAACDGSPTQAAVTPGHARIILTAGDVWDDGTGYQMLQDAAAETQASWKNPFADVNTGDWFYGDMAYVVRKCLMTGTSATAFSPQTPMTRAIMVAVLWHMAGSPQPQSAAAFTDLTQDWYMQAVTWTAEHKIVTGYDNLTFGPDDPVTREQVAAILYRFLEGGS